MMNRRPWPGPDTLAERLGMSGPAPASVADALDAATVWAAERCPRLRMGAGHPPDMTAADHEAVLTLAAALYRARNSPAGAVPGFPWPTTDPEWRRATQLLGIGRAGKAAVR
jgi:hypothetical protein